MLMKDEENIRSYIEDNYGDERLLSQWVGDVNNIVPSNRRQTTRQVAAMFKGFGKYFTIERKPYPVRYCFQSS